MMKKSAALKKVVRETKVEASPKRAVSRRIGVSKASENMRPATIS